MMDLARGGVLLTGEGGDEVFGIKRITPLTKVLAARGRVDRRVYAHLARAVAPARPAESDRADLLTARDRARGQGPPYSTATARRSAT